jgi:hypothetical protein
LSYLGLSWYRKAVYKTCQEIARVLRSDGVFIMVSHVDPEDDRPIGDPRECSFFAEGNERLDTPHRRSTRQKRQRGGDGNVESASSVQAEDEKHSPLTFLNLIFQGLHAPGHYWTLEIHSLDVNLDSSCSENNDHGHTPNVYVFKRHLQKMTRQASAIGSINSVIPRSITLLTH